MRTFKPLKEKKCRFCGLKFQPSKSTIIVCGYLCAINLIRKKASDEKISRMKIALKSHKDYIQDLQKVFNTYIRKRDELKPCVSCGVFKAEEFHAGHYIATTYQYLRFNELNVWKQCSKCNTHLRGNSIPYRMELINRIGIEAVEKLEHDRNKLFKITIPEIKKLIEYYKLKIKSL